MSMQSVNTRKVAFDCIIAEDDCITFSGKNWHWFDGKVDWIAEAVCLKFAEVYRWKAAEEPHRCNSANFV